MRDELGRLLEAHAPGRRVLVMESCVDSIALAGFDVIAVDAEEPVLPGAVDAAVCLPWQGGRRDADLRRLYRRVRDALAEDGVLVIAARREGVRPYSPTELDALVAAAGFTVTPADPDAGWVLARPVPAPPSALAVATWGAPSSARLDLRYATDEAELLRPTPEAVWTRAIRELSDGGAGLVSMYPVEDPYGGVRGAVVVGEHFGVPVAPAQLTFGAGVTALLHGLAGLADGGPVLAPALAHPDLAVWALSGGARLHLADEPASVAQLIELIHAIRPTLVHLDRPGFTADALPLPELAAVAAAAATVHAPVLVDESPAPYLGPADSAATLVPTNGNLVVLRGFTKAYSWGGLRCGFALAGHGVAGRVRELVAPMQVGELDLHVALRLLAEGDVFAELRARIHKVKPAFIESLLTVGLRVTGGHPDVPWVVVDDPDGTATRMLSRCGVRGLEPAPLPVSAATPPRSLHLTVPLSDDRIALCQELISSA